MRRSEINSIMRSAKQFLAEYQFQLSLVAS